ncbi:hypothetical protein HII31_08616 [Pseudocercospora fuligena]|uniref:Transcription factor domain-containing protein n=1 Tax=Pseudocercospora fuligena TaxID=685502 RepID=A0A8H6VG80_9PEZI|nr:hypothetical protein HII31_08616 [Pseudocercospora fuligena]
MSPLLELPGLDLSSPMMSSAVDTLCLAHLGSTTKDQRLLQASQNAYGKTLNSMLLAMRGRTDQVFTPREVVASCLLMSVYNDGDPANNDKWQNYATHLFGASQYAEAVGPSTFDPTQPFDQRLLMWLRFQSLFVSVAKRKRFFWSQPEWRKLENKFTPGGSRDWYPILVPLPGLLEKADALLHPSTDVNSETLSVFSLCARFDKIREDLLSWVETDFAGSPGIAAVTDFDAFDMAIEEHCFMTTSSTFTTFHIFKDPAHAMRSVCSWFMILIADCTLLRLIQACPDAYPAIHRTPAEIEHKAYNAAVDICKSVYYYSSLQSMAFAHLICVWIDLAQVFFQECGATKEAGWCQAALIATNMRIRRLVTTNKARNTLCRIGDLFGTFNEPCRYRSRPKWPPASRVISAG